MSNKVFEMLSKYYTFSKKFMPFVILAVMLGISFLVNSFGMVLGIYLGLSVLHLVALVVIKRLLTKQLLNDVQNELKAANDTEIINNDKE